MSRLRRSMLCLRVIKELLRYDVIQALFGFKAIHSGLCARRTNNASSNREPEACVHDAVRRMVPFYWKRVQCLQRSYVTARVLRTYGTQADVVIGYQLAPFLAHAWVEVAGRIVNDSPAFQNRLQVLERF
jgi:hypothetical protein